MDGMKPWEGESGSPLIKMRGVGKGNKISTAIGLSDRADNRIEKKATQKTEMSNTTPFQPRVWADYEHHSPWGNHVLFCNVCQQLGSPHKKV